MLSNRIRFIIIITTELHNYISIIHMVLTSQWSQVDYDVPRLYFPIDILCQ